MSTLCINVCSVQSSFSIHRRKIKTRSSCKIFLGHPMNTFSKKVIIGTYQPSLYSKGSVVSNKICFPWWPSRISKHYKWFSCHVFFHMVQWFHRFLKLFKSSANKGQGSKKVVDFDDICLLNAKPTCLVKFLIALASSMKQSMGRHIALLYILSWFQSQPVFALTSNAKAVYRRSSQY